MSEKSPYDPLERGVDEVTDLGGSQSPLEGKQGSIRACNCGRGKRQNGNKSQWSTRRQKKRWFLTNLALQLIEEHGSLACREIAVLLGERSCYHPNSFQIGSYLRKPLREGIIRKKEEYRGGGFRAGSTIVWYEWVGYGNGA
jgi:hypothetical protein